MITKFTDVFADLKEKGICKRMVAAWAVDEHTIERSPATRKELTPASSRS